MSACDPGSRQITVDEGREGLAGLRDLAVVVAELQLNLPTALLGLFRIFLCGSVGMEQSLAGHASNAVT